MRIKDFLDDILAHCHALFLKNFTLYNNVNLYLIKCCRYSILVNINHYARFQDIVVTIHFS
jgi:hypothetical protein